MTTTDLNELLSVIKGSSDRQFDASSHELIDDVIGCSDVQEKAMKLLYLLDCCVCFSLSSGFIVVTLQQALEVFCSSNNLDITEITESPDRIDPLKTSKETI